MLPNWHQGPFPFFPRSLTLPVCSDIADSSCLNHVQPWRYRIELLPKSLTSMKIASNLCIPCGYQHVNFDGITISSEKRQCFCKLPVQQRVQHFVCPNGRMGAGSTVKISGIKINLWILMGSVTGSYKLRLPSLHNEEA